MGCWELYMVIFIYTDTNTERLWFMKILCGIRIARNWKKDIWLQVHFFSHYCVTYSHFESCCIFHLIKIPWVFTLLERVIETAWVHVQSFHSCLTLCEPMWLQPPGSFVHGISQARILEWVAMLSSRGSSWPRNRTCVFHIFYISRWVLYP